MPNKALPFALAVVSLCLVAACGGSESSSGTDTSNGTTGETTSNGTSTSNGTTSTSNGTTATSNGTTATSNGTTATSNGTTATSNGTTVDGVGLFVKEADARSCEVVLQDPQNKLKDIVFDDSVEGRLMRRGERVAVAFFSKTDASFAPGSVGFALEGTDTTGITITVQRCFGTTGNIIDGAEVTLTP